MATRYKKRTPEQRKELVTGVLDDLLEKLTNEETFPEIMGNAVMHFDEDVPARSWSLRNRMIMATHYTFDGRTYGGWKAVGRFVKKGERGFHILEPGHKMKENEDTGEKEVAFTYFYPSIRFGWLQTEGDPMPYEDKLESIKLETMPLMEVAEVMGLKVHKSFTSHGEAGYAEYGTKKLVMCDNDELTFLHELSHHIDFELFAKEDGFKDEAMREVVAEFSAAFLASMYGLKTNLAFTKKYVAHYSEKKHVAVVLTKAMERVEAIFEYVQRIVEPKRVTVMNSTLEEVQAVGGPVPLF